MSDVAVTQALVVLEAISDAFSSRDWERLRSLYHDQARISSVAAGDRILSADELIEVLAGIEEGSYSTDDAATEALDQYAVVVSGLVRQRDDVGSMFTWSAWLLTFRDGLVWRSKAYRSPEEARAEYHEHGVDLGMS
jgi:hypothetical protein